MMKFAAALALLASSASAFAPMQQSARSVTALDAERSTSLPFMNRPALVSVLIEIVRILGSVWGEGPSS
jgi:light-harvesting complex I chlorophyll a/b binding protein 1